MKRMITMLLAVIMMCGMIPTAVSAQNVQIEVNGYNCTRDTGKLIVYTDEYGDSTGTNFWGAEAIVGSDGRVTEITNGNADIPAGGFVVSGHDDDGNADGKRMKTWVLQNIAVGDYVAFDRRTSLLTVSDQPIQKESPFFSFDNPADGVNTVRDTNQMIVYTPEHGTFTGTNEYGYEIVVENGVVTKLGGNNSAIPENGYVVSLHGSTAKWMRVKVVKGMTAQFDPQTLNVVFTYSADGLRQAVAYAFDQAQRGIDEAKAAFVYADYQAAQADLDVLRAEYQTVCDAYDADKDDNAFADGCDGIVERADVLCNALCDSYPVQYRGVWVRPSQKTAAEVDAYVKELHDACINFVCVEGWFENGVIMEVPEDSLFGRHPSFKFDVLQAYIDACHKYGMECHLWMPIMCIGSSIDNGYEERTVPGQREEWLSLDQNGSPYNKDGFMMIDPANDDARVYMLEFYEYLVTTYDIDCFEMDYIRYYAATEEADFGYTQAAFAGFEEAYGHGVTPTYDPEASYWEDWCQYRRDCVTQWVRDIRAMIDRAAPDVVLAADVAFPFEHALDKVYQNFPAWLEEGLLDILHPMAYGDGYGEQIRQAAELGGEQCVVVTGLGAQMDILGAKELERQARENTSYGAYGECYFEAKAYLADQVASAAKQTVYRNDAIPMFLDKTASVKALLQYMNGRVDDVILPLGGMTEAEATAVKEAIAAAEAGDTEAWTALYEAIDSLTDAQAKQVLLADLGRAQRVVRVMNKSTDTPVINAGDSGHKIRTPLGWLALGAAAAAVAAVVTAVILCRPKKKKDQ